MEQSTVSVVVKNGESARTFPTTCYNMMRAINRINEKNFTLEEAEKWARLGDEGYILNLLETNQELPPQAMHDIFCLLG